MTANNHSMGHNTASEAMILFFFMEKRKTLMTKILHGKRRIYVVKKARFKTGCLLKKKKKSIKKINKSMPTDRNVKGRKTVA